MKTNDTPTYNEMQHFANSANLKLTPQLVQVMTWAHQLGWSKGKEQNNTVDTF